MPQKKGKRRREARRYVQVYLPEDYYQSVMLPLLSMFAMADDVFTEDDALTDPHKAKMGLGRLYEEWKRVRKKLDPEFIHIPDERPEKFIPKMVKAERRSRRLARGSQPSSSETK